MLSEGDLESLLKRYRVADPSTDLGPTILAEAARIANGSDLAWTWGPLAAAALVVVWLAAQVAMTDAAADPVRDAEVAFVAEILGGGEDAAAYADLVVPVGTVDDPIGALAEDPWLVK